MLQGSLHATILKSLCQTLRSCHLTNAHNHEIVLENMWTSSHHNTSLTQSCRFFCSLHHLRYWESTHVLVPSLVLSSWDQSTAPWSCQVFPWVPSEPCKWSRKQLHDLYSPSPSSHGWLYKTQMLAYKAKSEPSSTLIKPTSALLHLPTIKLNFTWSRTSSDTWDACPKTFSVPAFTRWHEIPLAVQTPESKPKTE